ncbi:MAG: hypothetical protein H7Z42_04610 [Roseiflexaceae bacterium]|nr:hypothetical protein [Roseiflexaceae bacterium]
MSIAKPQTTSPSLIDIINQGFAAVNRRIWVIAAPVLLNLVIWYGAQVSIRPLVDSFVSLMQQQAAVIENAGSPEQIALWRQLGTYNVLPGLDALKLVPHLVPYEIVAPSEAGLALPAQVQAPLDPGRALLEVSNLGLALGLYAALNLLLIPLGAVFFTMLAGAVRAESAGQSTFLVRSGRAIVSFLGYAALLLAALLIIGLPLAIVGGLLVLVSPALGTFVALLVLTASFWLTIYLGFTPEAIVLGGLNPFQAIRASFGLVRRNFWSTLLLLVVSVLITIGLGMLWNVLVESALGLPAAIIGSAYIGSGLIAARMVFYQVRIGNSGSRVAGNKLPQR